MDTLTAFPTAIGWFAMVGSARVLKRLTLGHRSSQAAVEALGSRLTGPVRIGGWNRPLVRRLQAYASGAPDDFRDVQVDPGPLTDFQRRVVRACRRIRFGKTITYGRLAARAGSPGAARAVGRSMAANGIPLVIPCHRVVAAGGRLGGYSAPGGLALKRRLLDLEAGRIS